MMDDNVHRCWPGMLSQRHGMKLDVSHLAESEHLKDIVKMGEDVKDDFLRLKKAF